MTVTIGSQTNVPDPGSPITSPWAQDTARKLVHTFATAAARDGWVSPPDGAMSYTQNTNQLWLRKDAAWTLVDDQASSDARYVLDAGDTMSGTLTISSGGLVVSAGNIAVTAGSITAPTGPIRAGSDPAANDSSGAELSGGGSIRDSVAVAGTPNMILRRLNPGAGTGEQIVRFTTTNAGTVIGTITIASATTVAYNTTSDPRLKVVTGDVADAADLVAALGAAAFRGRWLDPATGEAEAGGDEWVMLSSHDVEDVAAFAVTGERDGRDADDTVVPQQVNYPALVPLLCAALSQALTRIEALEQQGGGT